MRLSIIWIFLLVGCTEVFVEDIEGEVVVLVAPSDNVIVDQTNITFLWDEIPFVDQYEFQIVRPSFDSIISVVNNETISENSIKLILEEGEYEWRVRGVNEGGKTIYSNNKLWVELTTDQDSNQVQDDHQLLKTKDEIDF